MRQLSALSAPGRFAVRIVTSLAVVASAGCMSVGDDEGKPAPSRSADRRGSAAEPDGGTGAGPGAPHAWQGRTSEGGAGGAGGGEKGTAPGASPSASSAAKPSSEPSKGARPRPGEPTPPPGHEPVPSKEPTRPVPSPTPPVPQSPDPVPEPEPEPSKPQDTPSGSPAGDMRTSLMSAREMAGEGEGPGPGPGPGSGKGNGNGMRKETAASPQMGPV
ncbi:hypothetical protein [Streptomyces sp. NPDC056244]|uniref:hypothetical protein n=1 Tax=Streptomyces sp. NPDC056244 TaxID=3345762 RepID=UPI0035E212A3